MKPTAIAVFLKYPQAGRVKTRLARDLGEEPAKQIYEKMLEQVLGILATLPPDEFTPILFCDPYRPREDYETYFASYPYSCRSQNGNTLGERLENAFSELLKEHPQAVAIGTDCIDLSRRLFQETREKLSDRAELVIGPATDGGYYLIGMKRFVPALFQGVNWSTGTVLMETLDRARAENMPVYCLPELRDVDTLADLKASGWDPLVIH